MKENFKKALLCTLSGVMAASALAGCAGGGKKTGEKPTAKEDGTPLLYVITTSKTVDEELHNKALKQYAEFQEYYAGIGKKVEIVPDNFSFNIRDYAAKALGGQLPTYYYVPLTEAKGVIAAGYAKDITPWMEKYGFLDGMDEKIYNNIAVDKDGDGKKEIYLMPTSVYSTGIAVNMDLLRQAGYIEADGTPHQPATYEELAQMAADIKAKTGVPGFSIPTMGNAGGWRFTPIAWAYGVDFMEQDADGKWKATFNTPECIEALQWIYDLKWKYDCLPADVMQDNAKERNAFGAGAAAMCFAEGSSTTTFLQGGMAKENLGFIKVPAGPQRRVALIGGGYNVFNSMATDEQIDAAFEFLEWAGSGRKLDDAVKKNMYDKLLEKSEKGELIGVLNASPYTDGDAKRAYEIELNTKLPEEGGLRNIPLEQVRLYNDQSDIEWQQEEPVEAQACYKEFEAIIQACLTDKNADIPTLLAEAEKSFQITLDTSISANAAE